MVIRALLLVACAHAFTGALYAESSNAIAPAEISTGSVQKILRGDPTGLVEITDSAIAKATPAILPPDETLGDVITSTVPIYSSVQLAEVDRCLGILERPIADATGKKITFDCFGSVTQPVIWLGYDLVATRVQANWIVGKDRVAYYAAHPREYLQRCIDIGLGPERIKRFRAIFSGQLNSPNPAERASAVSALSILSSSTTLSALVDSLHDASPRVRLLAADALERGGRTEGRGYLLNILDSPNNWEFIGAVQALASTHQVPRPARARLEAMARGEGSVTIADRPVALGTLRSVDNYEDAFPIYLHALKTGEVHLVSNALTGMDVQTSKALLTHSDYELIADIAGRKTSNAMMKETSFRILSRDSDPSLRRALFSRYKDTTDSEIRSGLAVYLGKQGKAEDLPWLVSLLDDSLRMTRWSADSAIRNISKVDLSKDYPKLNDRVAARKLWWTRLSEKQTRPAKP